MTVASLRATVAPGGAIRKTLLLLSLVVAIVGGLLVMHTFSSSAGGHSGLAATTTTSDHQHAASMAAADASGGSVASADCAGICDPGHSMSSMVCTLALLFTGFLMAAVALRRVSLLFPRDRPARQAIWPFGAVLVPPQPSLEALSVSRT